MGEEEEDEEEEEEEEKRKEEKKCAAVKRGRERESRVNLFSIILLGPIMGKHVYCSLHVYCSVFPVQEGKRIQEPGPARIHAY